jgi:hypothetical protein
LCSAPEGVQGYDQQNSQRKNNIKEKTMTSETIEALSEFKIVAKPTVTSNYKGKYDKLYIALKNLANDRSIELPNSVLGNCKINSFRTNIRQQAKKRGINVAIIQQNGSIFIFKK